LRGVDFPPGGGNRKGSDFFGNDNDPERCEYFVPVHWLQTVPLEAAVQEIGLFGNQNTVCKPTVPKWRSTVERLKEKFSDFNEPTSVVPNI
jgi:hypothetical protein